jgi:biopolymer transport protein TolQ
VASWAAIFGKVFSLLKRVRRSTTTFEREFWSGTSLNDLLPPPHRQRRSPAMERIFASGMREFQKLRERRITDAGTLLDGARRAMRASYQRELDVIEGNLVVPGQRGLGQRRMWACSARCGASCMPSPAWPTCSR